MRTPSPSSFDDRTAEKTGKNGPSLPVPPEEEEEAAAGAAAGEGASAGSKGGVFGEAEVAPTPAGQEKDPFAEAETALPAILDGRAGQTTRCPYWEAFATPAKTAFYWSKASRDNDRE